MGNKLAAARERRRGNSAIKHASEASKSVSLDAKPPLTFGKDPSLKREDYIVSKQVDATVVRRPGTINGQQFLIEDCRNTSVFVLDHCTSVQIDECHDCTVFIGPCTASLFVRNCSNTTLVCIVQQFRTRDCVNMYIALFSTTAPIIETSRQLRIWPFAGAYMGLQHQLDAAKFNVWNNKWSEIFDFTPSGSGGSGNWSVGERGDIDMLTKLPPDVIEELGYAEDSSIVPNVHGLHARVSGQVVFVCVSTGNSEVAHQLASLVAAAATASDNVGAVPKLIQTRQFSISPIQAKTLFGKQATTHVKNATEKNGGGIIAMEWAATAEDVQSLVAHESFQQHASALYVEAGSGATAKVDLCWNEWKDVI